MLWDRVRRHAATVVVAAPVLLASAGALAQPRPVGPSGPAAPAAPAGPAASKPAAPAPERTLAERQSIARVKAEQGLKLFGAGRWTEAYDWFREADVLYHAPTLVLYMARCQRQAGKLLEARTLYGQLISEPIPGDANAAFVEAHDNAKSELEKLRALIPVVDFAVLDVPRASVRLTLDGAPLTEDRKELNPGPHVLEIAGGAGEHNSKSFTLVEGPNPRVEIRLRNPLPPPPPKPLAVVPPPRGSYVPGAVVLGVGGVGLVVGAVTGAITLSKASSVKSQCTGDVCPASAQGAAGSASTLGNVSTAMFVVGGVAAAAGVVLLVARPRFQRSGPRQGQVEWNARVGAGRVEIGGSF
jgi:hypothetical protein